MNNLYYYTGLILWRGASVYAIIWGLLRVYALLRTLNWFGWLTNWLALLYFSVMLSYMKKDAIQVGIVTLNAHNKKFNHLSGKILLCLFEKRLDSINNKR